MSPCTLRQARLCSTLLILGVCSLPTLVNFGVMELKTALRTGHSATGKPNHTEEGATARSYKTILFYNPYFYMPDYNFGFGREPFVKYGCAVTNCLTTNNHSLLDSVADFDALVFHTPER